jgi:CRP/FNR family cyclic AMP-dependent transcriptional regulator
MAEKQFFAFLEPAEESALLAAATVKVFRRGEVVLDQNVALRAMFVIDSGSVRIERDNGGQMVPLAILADGELFGEMSFVDGERTSARVVTREVTQVRIVDMGVVDNLNEVDPTFASRLYRSIAATLVNRLRTTSLDRV